MELGVLVPQSTAFLEICSRESHKTNWVAEEGQPLTFKRSQTKGFSHKAVPLFPMLF